MLMTFILFAVATLQCGPKDLADEDKAVDGDERAVAWYNEHREMWKRTSSDNYSFTYHYSCFCGLPVYGAITVSVRNGDVITGVKRVYPEEQIQEPFDQDAYYTIDELFDRVRGAIARADEYRISYHPQFGYPLEATVDPSFGFIDEEYRFIAYGYEPN